jgi:hypothetical protein
MLAFRCGAEQGPAQGQVEMINYVMVGTNRFDAAVAVYDAPMTDMGATRAYSPGLSVGEGPDRALRVDHFLHI